MIREQGNMKKRWRIRRYNSHQDYLDGKLPEMEIDAEGRELPGEAIFNQNVLLNEGMTALLNLLTGETETAFSNANAYLGVGESSTAAAASQTGLQGTSKTYKAMESSYPSISGQTVTFRAVFGSSDANNAWQEFTVANGNSDTADNLNRKVSDQGTKASGQTWTLDLEITFSQWVGAMSIQILTTQPAEKGTAIVTVAPTDEAGNSLTFAQLSNPQCLSC